MATRTTKQPARADKPTAKRPAGRPRKTAVKAADVPAPTPVKRKNGTEVEVSVATQPSRKKRVTVTKVPLNKNRTQSPKEEAVSRQVAELQEKLEDLTTTNALLKVRIETQASKEKKHRAYREKITRTAIGRMQSRRAEKEAELEPFWWI